MNEPRRLIPIVLAILLLAAAAPAQELPTLAVFQLETRGAEVTEQELDSLSDYLSGQAGEKLGARVVDWREVLSYLRTKDLYLCLDRRCQMEVERQLKADYSLAVTVAPMGKICLMNATLYPSQSPATQRTAMQRGPCGAENFVLAIDELLTRLAGPGPLKPPRPMAVAAAGPGPAARPPLVKRPEPVQRPDPTEQPDPTVAPAPSGQAEPLADPGDQGLHTQVVEPGEGGYVRKVDHYPRLQLTAGLMFAPAPLLLFERNGSRTSRKIPDHYGPQLSFEWRFASYLMVGGQTRILRSQEGYAYDGALRFGGFLPLSDKLTLLGFMDLGLVEAAVDVAGGEEDYSGFMFDLGLGLRYYFTKLLGLHFSLGGSLNQLMLDRDDSTKIVVLRLESYLGLVFGW